MKTAEIARPALEFLRKYGHLSEPEREPDFREREIINPLFTKFRLNDTSLNLDRASAPMHIIDTDEEYKADYERIALEQMVEEEFQTMPLRDIPNSKEYVLIDIGSGLGEKITLPFAEQRGKVKVYMVDDLSKEHIKAAWQIGLKRASRQELMEARKSKKKFYEFLTHLVQRDGYENVTYKNKKLSIDDLEIGIEQDIKGKKATVTGFDSPGGLAELTARIAARLGAERAYITNTAIEKISPDDRQIRLLRDYLRRFLSETETKKALKLLYDPNETSPIERYDYDRIGQRMFAKTLKLMMALAQGDLLEREGYTVEIRSNVNGYKKYRYNKADFNIMAYRAA